MSEHHTTPAFQTFLEGRNDVLDNAVYRILRMLCTPAADDTFDATQDAESVLPWDMALIGPLLEAAEYLLSQALPPRPTCHPYYAEELPCYEEDDCQHPGCPFRACARMEGE